MNVKIKCAFAALLLSGSVTAFAQAMPVPAITSFTLTRLSLNNVPDAMGLWQHSGGQVLRSGVAVGNYAEHRRVTTGGTEAQNTAMWTMTIFFNGSTPPANITIQGSHDFSSGRFIGSVSAASSLYKAYIGATVSGTAGATGSLTVTPR